MTHELKIWPQYYCRVADGSKTFEVRNNDRGFQAGDKVALHEWCPKKNAYQFTDPLVFKIGYVLAIDSERVVFSLLKIEENK